MDKKRVKDIRYLRMARIWSENSYAVRLKVGCLIVSKEGNIISDGYNGTPRGFENVCEAVDPDAGNELAIKQVAFSGTDCEREWRECYEIDYLRAVSEQGYKIISKPYVLHAEANAITKLARSTQSCEGATIYVTDMPCVECAKLIIQSGISRVVYERPYRLDDGIILLKRAGIEITHIPSSEIASAEKGA